MFSRKAITPIVAVMTLLLVSVGAFILVQNWLIQEQTQFEADLRIKDIERRVEILSVNETSIRVNNQLRNNLPVDQIFIEDNECSGGPWTLNLEENILSISSCTSSLSSLEISKVSLITPIGTLEEYEIVELS